MRNRRQSRKRVNYRCLDCNNEFVPEGTTEMTNKCPRCGSKELWGKPYHEPN